MNSRQFSLIPFLTADPPPPVELFAAVARHFTTLFVKYELLGALEEIIIPVAENMPLRKNALWEETCFEVFLGVNDSDHYWEFNLSPSGNWNVYRFDSYRQGMQEEKAFGSLPFSVERRSGVLSLSLEIDMAKIIPSCDAVRAGVSAVIRKGDGRLTYWALDHPGPQADFHRRDGFIAEL